MDEVRAMNKIEANLPQDKIDFINDAHQKELQHWKKIVKTKVKTKMTRSN